MAKYHINGKGEPGPCRAEKNCPFGGDSDHYATPEAAREAYEATQKPFAKTDGESQALAEAKRVFASVHPRSYSKGDFAVVEKLMTGAKVTDAAFDKMLEGIRERSLYRTSYPQTSELYRNLKVLREERGTPSTLPTVEGFDPATQSVMSNPQARTHLSVAMTALRNEASHAEHMESRRDQFAEGTYAPSEERTPERDEEEKEDAARYSYYTLEARRSQARIGAIVKEITWLQKNGKFQDDGPSVPLEQLQSGVQAKGTDHFNGTLRKVKP